VSPTDRDLLQELLRAYGPGGQEDGVRETVERCARLVAEFLCRPAPH
jgi:putative aminopeptidase FrvX